MQFVGYIVFINAFLNIGISLSIWSKYLKHISNNQMDYCHYDNIFLFINDCNSTIYQSSFYINVLVATCLFTYLTYFIVNKLLIFLCYSDYSCKSIEL